MAKYVDKFCLTDELDDQPHCKLYKGIDRQTNDLVFIRAYSLKFIDRNKLYHQKVLNEMTIIESIKSDFIAKPISYLKTTNNMYHVYDFYTDSNLKTYIEKNEKMTQKEALSMFLKMLRCLNDLHSNNIIHRNLRPSCFLLKEKRIFITSFFNAIQLENAEIENNEVIGDDSYYRAPEHIEKNYDYTKKSDLYSMGTILYEMLTGRLFNKDMFFQQKGEIDELCYNLIEKLIEEDPKLRFSSTEAIYFMEYQGETKNDDPNKDIKLRFGYLKNKLDFLNRFGDFLYTNFNQGKIVISTFYLVTKQIYLVIKNFKDYYKSLDKRNKDDKALRALEEFLNAVYRESLSKLMYIQNLLKDKMDLDKFHALKEDLDVIEEFSDFPAMLQSYVAPLAETDIQVSQTFLCKNLCFDFMKNCKEDNFLNSNKNLIITNTD